jgi:hypothetical protein
MLLFFIVFIFALFAVHVVKVLHTDLKVPTIREEITKLSVKYRDKITTYPYEVASTLVEEEEPRRLKRFKPTYLTTRLS